MGPARWRRNAARAAASRPFSPNHHSGLLHNLRDTTSFPVPQPHQPHHLLIQLRPHDSLLQVRRFPLGSRKDEPL
jgi:hypothetical protein